MMPQKMVRSNDKKEVRKFGKERYVVEVGGAPDFKVKNVLGIGSIDKYVPLSAIQQQNKELLIHQLNLDREHALARMKENGL